MKAIGIVIATSTAITVLCGSFISVQAGTTAYVTGGLLSGGLDKCIKDAKVAATKAGFSESQEVLLDDDKKAGDFHADQKGSTLHMTVRCAPPQGVWSLAVSGIDNEQTYKGYNEVLKAFE